MNLKLFPIQILWNYIDISPFLYFTSLSEDEYIVSLGGVRLSPLGTSATVGLSYQPRMIREDYGAVGGMRICRRTEVLGENLPHCHFVLHKSHMI
jgi:hypothetical protein